MSESEVRKRKGEKDEKSPSVSRAIQTQTEEEQKKSDMQIAQEKYRKFFTRTIWGTMMIVVFGAILYVGHIAVSTFIYLIQALSFKEIIALRYIEAKEKKIPRYRTMHWYFLFCMFYIVYGPNVLRVFTLYYPQYDFLRRYFDLSVFILYVAGLLGFVLTLKKNLYKYQFGQLAWTIMTLFLVVVQSHFFVQNIFVGLIWFVLPVSLIICNDIMAYMCGMAFGQKWIQRPLTKLSPNKTWEGFIGALICTLVWAFFFSSFLANFDYFICPKQMNPSESIFGSPHCDTRDLIFEPQIYHLPRLIASMLHSVGIHLESVVMKPIQLHSLVFALFAGFIAPFGFLCQWFEESLQN